MSSTTGNPTSSSVVFDSTRAPPERLGGVGLWLKTNLFSSIPSSIVSLILLAVIIWVGWDLLSWGVIHAVWTVPQGANGPDTAACRAEIGIGACWALIPEKFRFIMFGFYPYDEQWRAAIVVVLFLGLFIASANRSFWRKELLYVWLAALVVIGVLMWGGVFGLTYVAQDQWGGLPITLILATFGLALAFPLAILVALGRRSTRLPAVKLICVLYVELIRGVPLISLLFMASVMFPLFLPDGIDIDKLLRAQVAIILFAGAYLAEVVRAGLQSLPKGQAEAADALGLSYGKKTILVVLPQALKLVIPPLVNTFIGFFKDTSLVLIIGIYDLLKSGLTAVVDPNWQPYGTEVYIFLAAVYFAFCFAMSKYSRNLERVLDRGRRR
jgi:general L-amino acid transport system permease protein